MRRAASFLFRIGCVYVVICALAFLFQERMLFYPRDARPALVDRLDRVGQPVGGQLGWVVPAPESAPLVFYFGGNAEDVTASAWLLARQVAVNWVILPYRGYAGRAGAPSEQALFQDAVRAYDSVVDEVAHDGRRFAMGRSLGSGVAVHLALRRRLDGVVLVTPYDSIASVASTHYPWLPVRALLRHPFDSLAAAGELQLPALFLVARHDRVIPPAHAEALVEGWAGERTVYEFDAGHNDVERATGYWDAVRSFVGR